MLTDNVIPRLTTPGVIARRLGQPLHRVLYVLRTRSYISPVAKAGTLRLYDSDAVSAVEQELVAIDAGNNGRDQGRSGKGDKK
ncbi:MAG TPA: hypothetical protein DIU00_18610 [Phycisphaerales bacterium]|nr:hypothetical protein [Phycisphaerales bacterium]